ncbi:MAG: hypothetical protein HS128_12410 [Ideonella sp.]|nr:hypothetical protein [Ideonella sp.]
MALARGDGRIVDLLPGDDIALVLQTHRCDQQRAVCDPLVAEREHAGIAVGLRHRLVGFPVEVGLAPDRAQRRIQCALVAVGGGQHHRAQRDQAGQRGEVVAGFGAEVCSAGVDADLAGERCSACFEISQVRVQGVVVSHCGRDHSRAEQRATYAVEQPLERVRALVARHLDPLVRRGGGCPGVELLQRGLHRQRVR